MSIREERSERVEFTKFCTREVKKELDRRGGLRLYSKEDLIKELRLREHNDEIYAELEKLDSEYTAKRVALIAKLVE
jgi:hypothetical protein